MPVPRRALLVLVLAALAASLLPALAAAAGKNSTQVVLSLKFPAFHGKLTSPRQACLGSRKVKVYRERNGSKKKLGSDTSEDNGKWSVPVGKNLTSGAYYVTVAARGKCKAAKSKTVVID